MKKKNNKTISFAIELVWLSIALIVGGMLLILNSFYNFLSLPIMIGVIVLIAICIAALIAIIIISKKWNKQL